jgi:hypothetical protein
MNYNFTLAAGAKLFNDLSGQAMALALARMIDERREAGDASVHLAALESLCEAHDALLRAEDTCDPIGQLSPQAKEFAVELAELVWETCGVFARYSATSQDAIDQRTAEDFVEFVRGK